VYQRASGRKQVAATRIASRWTFQGTGSACQKVKTSA
jgi:hypothetical protein